MTGLATVAARVRGHPRHAVLAALVAGLLLGPRAAGAVPAAAAGLAVLVLVVRLRPAAALLVAAALVAAALGAEARVAHLARTGLDPAARAAVTGRATLLEQP